MPCPDTGGCVAPEARTLYLVLSPAAQAQLLELVVQAISSAPLTPLYLPCRVDPGGGTLTLQDTRRGSMPHGRAAARAYSAGSRPPWP